MKLLGLFLLQSVLISAVTAVHEEENQDGLTLPPHILVALQQNYTESKESTVGNATFVKPSNVSASTRNESVIENIVSENELIESDIEINNNDLGLFGSLGKFKESENDSEISSSEITSNFSELENAPKNIESVVSNDTAPDVSFNNISNNSSSEIQPTPDTSESVTVDFIQPDTNEIGGLNPFDSSVNFGNFNVNTSSFGFDDVLTNDSNPFPSNANDSFSFIPVENSGIRSRASNNLMESFIGLIDSTEGKKPQSSIEVLPTVAPALTRVVSALGQVSSPFFFLCHYPRHGEHQTQGSPAGGIAPSRAHSRLDVPHEQVTVTLTVLGNKTLQDGYTPSTSYEMGVTSSVGVDGFLLTAVQALTEHHAQVLAAPAPPQGGGITEGRVCSVLHSQSTRTPQREQTFMWVAPPAGTGCVAFLATGSVGDTIVYKDVNIFEVCERDTGPARLRVSNSLRSGLTPQPNLIFRDDFDSSDQLNTDIWRYVQGGHIRPVTGSATGSALLMNFDFDGYVETVPTDLTQAKDVHFTLSAGPCIEEGSVGVMFGRVTSEPDTEEPNSQINLVDIRSGAPRGDLNEPHTSSHVDEPNSYDSGSGSGDSEPDVESIDLESNSIMSSSGSGSNVLGDDPNAAQYTSEPIRCSHWELQEEILISATPREYTIVIPRRHQHHQGCIKFQSMKGSNTSQGNKCWVIDDFAVGRSEPKRTTLEENFEQVFSSSNWLFFKGGNVERACGSDSNTLVFSTGQSYSAFTTTTVDLSSPHVPLQDILSSQDFSNPQERSWSITGGTPRQCGFSATVLVMEGGGVRRLCSPVVDTRNAGSLKIRFSQDCSPPGTEQHSFPHIDVYLDKSGTRTSIKSVDLNALLQSSAASTDGEEFSVPLPLMLLQDESRVCVEQTDLSESGLNTWSLKSVVITAYQPSQPTHYLQARINLACSSPAIQHYYGRAPPSEPLSVVLESSQDYGLTWLPLHQPCLQGSCPAQHQPLDGHLSNGYSGGWSTVTFPLPYHVLSARTQFRVRQESGTGTWAVDNIYVGPCAGGCNGRGLCSASGACRCEYGYSGPTCAQHNQENPRYLSEPFTLSVQDTANLLEVWGGVQGHQCGLIGGSGAAGVFKGWGRRSLTTIDVNTTDSSLLQFHYFAGTVSDVGKCPGADHISEGVYLHYSCNGGVTWTLLQSLMPGTYDEPSHLSFDLPDDARQESCRFRLWQPHHSGPDKDMWAVDDITVTSYSLNNIQLEFDDLQEANSSLRFHLGTIGSSCNHSNALVFPVSSSRGVALQSESSVGHGVRRRLLETRSLSVGPSFMMQFELVIGCVQDEDVHPLDETTQDMENVVMLEYSLDHGLSWQLVQKPCSPSTPGCQSHFTRGTVYHISEFNVWKRVTLRLPRHTWSQATRLRLREGLLTAEGDPAASTERGPEMEWAVDNLYIGHQCNGLCSGHGRCTRGGCLCDVEFHSQQCLPINKLPHAINADFDADPAVADDGVTRNFKQQDDLSKYSISLVGGQVVDGSQGCGTIASGKNVYFGASGVRQLETDDMAARDLYSLQFHLTIGGTSANSVFRGTGTVQTRTCHRGTPTGASESSEGSVVVQYSTDGGLEWLLLQELVPRLYRAPKMFRIPLPPELTGAPSGVARFRIWQPSHGAGDQWAIDNLLILPDEQSGRVQSDAADGALTESPWLTITGHNLEPYCPDTEEYYDSDDGRGSAMDSLQSSDGDAQLLSSEEQEPSNEKNRRSKRSSLVLNGGELFREAVTKPLNLSEGDVIYFKINLGCSRGSSIVPSPVLLEYTVDGGLTWSLVTRSCPSSALHCTPPSLPSIYRPQLHKRWHQVMIDVDHRMALGPSQLRWRQENPSEGHSGEFALQSVYVGPPCPRHCSGHGQCSAATLCICDPGYSGKYCERAPKRRPSFMRDDPSVYVGPSSNSVPEWGGTPGSEASPWDQLEGASAVEEACGATHSDAMVLLFSDEGPRVAVLKEVDTRNVRSLQFRLVIGGGRDGFSRCKIGVTPRDNVVVQYSPDGGLHWNTLAEIQPMDTLNRTRPFSIHLPYGARTRQTMFKWWQSDPLTMSDSTDEENERIMERLQQGGPLQLRGDRLTASARKVNSVVNDRAEWQLGDVMLMENETVPYSLSSNEARVDRLQTKEMWFIIRGGSEGPSDCYPNETVVTFGRVPGVQFAETWDVEATEATMIQFDILAPCNSALDTPTDSGHRHSHRSAPSELMQVAVEYSSDGGESWRLVRETCAPPDTSCLNYDQPSVYNFPHSLTGPDTREKRRVMLELPRTVAGSRVRVRFRREEGDHQSWALGNVFLGDSCPWMCSGHGYCNEEEQCSCDEDYFGDICVPASVLPCELIETFNVVESQTSPSGRPSLSGGSPLLNSSSWWGMSGGGVGEDCGPLVAGSALVFAGEGVREITTTDMDMTAGQFIQFNIRLGCVDAADQKKAPSVSSWRGDDFTSVEETDGSDGPLPGREEGILVQYSINGGINWELLKEIHYALYSHSRFVSINLNDFPNSQSNATRFRFWQPYHPTRYGAKSWALDNVYIGGSPLVPNVLYEDFNGEAPINDAWVDWPGASIGQLCNEIHTRKSLVFGNSASGAGQRALYSKDISIYGDSIIQFDIKIGCEDSLSPSLSNISLEYSTDFGASWRSVQELDAPTDSWDFVQAGRAPHGEPPSLEYRQQRASGKGGEYYSRAAIVRGDTTSEGRPGRPQQLQRVSPDCLHELRAPTVYYWNSAPRWRREVIPLSQLQICGNVRFRWIENEAFDSVPLSWSLDNVYIGPACIYNCNGHGHCINGDTCICDEGYDGDSVCLPLASNPATAKMTFDDVSPTDRSYSSLLSRVSGGQVSPHCPVMEGSALVFTQDGERMMLTKDLDMSLGSVVQFYLRLGCDGPEAHHSEVMPILLQFSTDGGINWVLVAELTKDVKKTTAKEHATHFTIPLPNDARTNATQLRWWQPSVDGSYRGDWAIDEVYIGSSSEALTVFSPLEGAGAWLLTPGAETEAACASHTPLLHFRGAEGVRWAESPDLYGKDRTVLQMILTTSCGADSGCYYIDVEFSVDHGQHWHPWVTPSPPFPQFNAVEDVPPLYTLQYPSDLYRDRDVITLPLPPLARSRILRVRIIQHQPPRSRGGSWAIEQLYFGDTCEDHCSSRGMCVKGVCQCQLGWRGSSCDQAAFTLRSYLSEEFEGPISPLNWRKVVGGSLSEECSAGGVGQTLHFTGSCSRYLESTDLDLSDVHYIQFNVVAGCATSQREQQQRTSESDFHQQTQNNYYDINWEDNQGDGYYQETFDEIQTSQYSDLFQDRYDEPDLEAASSPYHGYFEPLRRRSKRSISQRQRGYNQRLQQTIQESEAIAAAGLDESKLIVQVSCDAGTTWTTIKSYYMRRFMEPTYVWLELPSQGACHGGRVRWWQSNGSATPNRDTTMLDWALDSIVIGGSRTGPSTTLAAHSALDYSAPMWVKLFNVDTGVYCESYKESPVAVSTLSEPALIQTSDIKVVGNSSLHFEIAVGCDEHWDNALPPVRLEYSLDFGFTWSLVRSPCLPGDATCHQLTDSSVFYGPLSWSRFVYPLEHVGPAKYVRFRWHQSPARDSGDLHRWSVRNVYIGAACPQHCLGRGYCMNGVCHCDPQYAGDYCQVLLRPNVPYIRDTFSSPEFLPHWAHVQGGLQSSGCGGAIEEPPAVTMEGHYTRSLTSVPVDTRSAKFVLFTAIIGGRGGGDLSSRPNRDGVAVGELCETPQSRMHNVFLQYSVDGGINWQLLRELDHHRYRTPSEDYVLIPQNARSAATLFRFWQPRQPVLAPSWSLDNIFIGGSEISAAKMIEAFEGEPQVSQWLFAPHSTSHHSYCHSNASALVWQGDSPGTRAITSQEIIVTSGHVLQFRISIGCDSNVKCPSQVSSVRLEYSRDGGASPWRLLYEPCLPSGSRDSDCEPYVYHGPSVFASDSYDTWTRVTIPLPEKAWSSTTQLRWTQGTTSEHPVPWSLASVYVGEGCSSNCHGRGDCLDGRCHCDAGYSGDSCEPRPTPHTPPLPSSLIDGFDGGLDSSWSKVLGAWTSRGCQSLAPYGTGKHLYFGGCGTRSATTKVLDTRNAGKIIFVLKIGSNLEGTAGCSLDTRDGVNVLDKGVVLQYSTDLGVIWKTINTHDPAEFRRPRRVVYSLPSDARKYGVQLRWWQPVHNDNSDQWALDNVEIDISDAKDTSDFSVLHETVTL